MWTENHNHMMYVFWDKKCNRQFFCHFEPFFALSPHYWPPKFKFEKYEEKKSWRYYPYFCPLILLAKRKINILKKRKKKPEDIIILHFCTTNDDHIMYGSWDMECDRIFCHFWLFFALLPPNNPDTQNFEKWKKNAWIYYHFTNTYQMWKSMMYGSWDIECDRFFSHFGPFFALFINYWNKIAT